MPSLRIRPAGRLLCALAQDLLPKIHALTATAGARQAAPPEPPLIPRRLSRLQSAVLMGVSTGGPAALDVLLPSLPATFPLPVLIVQHMPELFTGLLAERLDRNCFLHVHEVAEGDSVPPAQFIWLAATGIWKFFPHPAPAVPTLHIHQGPLENHCRPAVDVLFRSASSVYGSGVLAVILTGMGSDGLAGCRIIRARGGCVLAQNLATSTVWGMPGAVASAGLAHRLLPLSAIASEILRCVARSPLRLASTSRVGDMTMASLQSIDYGYLRQLVFSKCQNVLEPSRDYLFEARLGFLLQRYGMAHLGELVTRLRVKKDPELERAVAEAMTINETSFFRDSRPFELLRTELLPKLIEARRSTRSLRFWSAACSTGQEAYSLAMLLREHFPSLSGWEIRIDATDICAEVVDRARQGRYHRIEINRGLPARSVVRYFDHIGEDWFAKPEIRKLCNFRQANICGQDFPSADSVIGSMSSFFAM